MREIIQYAAGPVLDACGKNLEVKREPCETDEAYRTRILDKYDEREDSGMKKYDKDATCCKCGVGDIEDVYWAAHIYDHSDPYCALYRSFNQGEFPEDKPERIARTCKNCGYQWDESPMDVKGVYPKFDAADMGFPDGKEHVSHNLDAADIGGVKATCEMAKADAPVKAPETIPETFITSSPVLRSR